MEDDMNEEYIDITKKYDKNDDLDEENEEEDMANEGDVE